MKSKTVMMWATMILIWCFFGYFAIQFYATMHIALLAATLLVGVCFVGPRVARWVVAGAPK